MLTELGGGLRYSSSFPSESSICGLETLLLPAPNIQNKLQTKKVTARFGFLAPCLPPKASEPALFLELDFLDVSWHLLEN